MIRHFQVCACSDTWARTRDLRIMSAPLLPTELCRRAREEWDLNPRPPMLRGASFPSWCISPLCHLPRSGAGRSRTAVLQGALPPIRPFPFSGLRLPQRRVRCNRSDFPRASGLCLCQPSVRAVCPFCCRAVVDRPRAHRWSLWLSRCLPGVLGGESEMPSRSWVPRFGIGNSGRG